MLNMGGVRVNFKEEVSTLSNPIMAKEKKLSIHLSFSNVRSLKYYNAFELCYGCVTWISIGSCFYLPCAHD